MIQLSTLAYPRKNGMWDLELSGANMQGESIWLEKEGNSATWTNLEDTNGAVSAERSGREHILRLCLGSGWPWEHRNITSLVSEKAGEEGTSLARTLPALHLHPVLPG